MKLKKIEYMVIGVVLLALIGVAWAIDESITISSTPIGLSSANYLNFNRALIRAEDNYIRFTLDGITVPTSAGVGIKLEVGETLNLEFREHIVKFKAVRGSATDAKIKCTYWSSASF